MQSLAQELGITEFPYRLYDESGNRVYYEDDTGYWIKTVYDKRGNRIYYKDSTGSWTKQVFDEASNILHSDNSGGFSHTNIFNNGILIYSEDSNGKIVDINKSGDAIVDKVWQDILSMLHDEYKSHEEHIDKLLTNMSFNDTKALEEILKAFTELDYSYLRILSTLPMSLQKRLLKKIVEYKSFRGYQQSTKDNQIKDLTSDKDLV